MEELVSYLTAKLAKDKGFDISTQDKYQFINWEHPEMGTILNQGERRFGGISNWNHSCFQDKYRQYVSAPTQSQLQKWLREVHNINVWCFIVDENIWLNNIASHNSPIQGKYEEVLEIGLQEALKLVIIPLPSLDAGN
jgi:hypothetical protein